MTRLAGLALLLASSLALAGCGKYGAPVRAAPQVEETAAPEAVPPPAAGDAEEEEGADG